MRANGKMGKTGNWGCEGLEKRKVLPRCLHKQQVQLQQRRQRTLHSYFRVYLFIQLCILFHFSLFPLWRNFFFYFNTYTNIYIYIYIVFVPFTSISRTEKTESKSGYTHRKSVKKKNRTEACLGNNNKRNLFYTRMQKTTASNPPPSEPP